MKETLRSLLITGAIGLGAAGCDHDRVFHGNVNGNEVSISQSGNSRLIILHYGKHNPRDLDKFLQGYDGDGDGRFEYISWITNGRQFESLEEAENWEFGFFKGEKRSVLFNLLNYTNQGFLNVAYETVLEQSKRNKNDK